MPTTTERKARHGTHWMYMTHRCRCDQCRDFHNSYVKRYRIQRELGAPPRLVPVDDTRRKIHILEQMRITQTQIADAAGVAQSHISRIAAGDTKRVRREVAKKISDAYQELTSTHHGIKRSKWAGKFNPRVTQEEQHHAITEAEALEILDLYAQKYTYEQLAQLTGITSWTLCRVHKRKSPPGPKTREALQELHALRCMTWDKS